MESIMEQTFLPPPVAVHRGVSIPLIEIPFEKTRQELIDAYLLSLETYIQESQFKKKSVEDLVSHFLFLKSLAAVELDKTKKKQLLHKAINFSDILKRIESGLWSRVGSYLQESQFPIISWLIHQSPSSNFIASVIVEFNNKALTRNQIGFIRQFKESPAFFFPDLIYMLWVIQSFAANSSERAMHSSVCTKYYYAEITDNLLLRTQPKHVKFYPEYDYLKEDEAINSDFRYQMSKEHFLRIQGRTMLFSDDSNNVFAVKVLKKGEVKSCLSKEYQMTNYLIKHQHRLNLQSDLPKPLGVYPVKRTEILQQCCQSPHYEQFIELISDSEELEVYVYNAPLSYFTYLHDEQQTISELASSVKKNMHDLFVLLKEGIVFTQLADIFHTQVNKELREDKGRYYALVQLLKVFQPHLGRIDQWQKSVEFVNLRASGLADLGDNLPLSSLFTPEKFTRENFPEILTGGYHQTFLDSSTGTASSIYTGKRQIFGNYLYLNTIAEYLLVLQLTLGTYGDKVTRKMDDCRAKKEVWHQLGVLMFDSCAAAVSLITEMPQPKALKLLSQRAKIESHVLQTQFWMTPDYANMAESEIRMQQYLLYPCESGYEFNDELIPGIGLSVDGIHQDLGGYNQSLPLKELEKLLYATVTLIEGTTQLDNQFFQQAVRIKEMLARHCSVDECCQAVANLLEMTRIECHIQKDLALFYYEKVMGLCAEQLHLHKKKYEGLLTLN